MYSKPASDPGQSSFRSICGSQLGLERFCINFKDMATIHRNYHDPAFAGRFFCGHGSHHYVRTGIRDSANPGVRAGAVCHIFQNSFVNDAFINAGS